MSELKLKMGIVVDYDNENQCYRFENTRSQRRKKITSRLFPSLIGKNQWESIGHAILDRFSMIEQEYIDPFYMVRGDMAELLVKEYLTATYKQNKGVDVVLKTWDKEQVRYDNFPNNPKFGGLIDIAIAEPEEYRAVVEVKSKNKSKFKKIEANGGSNEEVLQGEFLAYMSGVDKYIMIYIFFSQDQENTIRDYIAREVVQGYEIESLLLAKEIIKEFKWTYNLFKIIEFENDVRVDLIQKLTTQADNVLESYVNSGKIAEKHFNKQERLYFDSKIARANGETLEILVDRPF